MVKFGIGDKILHPLYGIGTVVAIEEQRDNGMVRNHYVIELVRGKGRLLTPVERAGELGLRRPISKKERDKLLKVLGGTPRRLPKDYPSRRKKIRDTLREGSFVDIGGAVRDLAWRRTEGQATTGDRRLLDRAKDLLATELAASDGIREEEAMLRIDSALERQVSAWEADSE